MMKAVVMIIEFIARHAIQILDFDLVIIVIPFLVVFKPAIHVFHRITGFEETGVHGYRSMLIVDIEAEKGLIRKEALQRLA